MLKRVKNELISLIKKSVYSSLPSLKNKPLNIQLEIPRDKKHGNLSTNIAFQVSPILKEKPYKIASLIQKELLASIAKSKLSKKIDEIELKEPGFINFLFSDNFSYKVLKAIAETPRKIYYQNIGRGKKIQIEFVSANPTGPLSIAHGRQAAVGDSLANILKICGYKVTKEYFINDEGNQIDALGNSVLARYLQLQGKETELPKDGYEGDYIIDIAKELNKKVDKKFVNNKKINALNIVSIFSIKKMLNEIKKDLKSFNVAIDVWFSQKRLTKEDKINEVIRDFIKRKLIYEKDNALWFKSTKFGDDKDRVVVKSTGEYTYLAPDIAYHKDKYKRGFRRVINIWGPDHHGYIGRLQAAVTALGYPKDFLKILIIQLATLYKDKKPISMSTRKGQYITLRQLIKEVGRDVGRFFFLMRRENSHLDFDLELAKKRSSENPVYYVQYAHARICSIIASYKKSKKKLLRCNYSLLKSQEEKDLIKILIEFPNILESITLNLEPYFLTIYLRKLAESFHVFYQKHRVLSDDVRLTTARLKLITAVKNILQEGLSLLGISSPTKM